MRDPPRERCRVYKKRSHPPDRRLGEGVSLDFRPSIISIFKTYDIICSNLEVYVILFIYI
jgi:hypothetical protein